MITKKTVLILGAGASYPFNLLLGDELKLAILNLTKNAATIWLNHGVDSQTTINFHDALSKCGLKSIDAFLRDLPQFINLGKLTIAKCLLDHENSDLLFAPEARRCESSWYEHLFGEMNDSFESFDKNNLSIITFNYDRSLEHFLHTSLCNSSGKGSVECTKKLKAIPIIHVHGQLGYLPWQGTPCLNYGTASTVENVITAANGIKIIHEDIDDSPEFQKACQLLEDAEKILILGLGYHEINLKRLKIHKLGLRSKDLFGTAKGLSRKMLQVADKHTLCSINPLSNNPAAPPHRQKSPHALKFHDKTVFNFLHDHILFD